MKKVLCALVSFILLVSLVGCGSTSDTKKSETEISKTNPVESMQETTAMQNTTAKEKTDTFDKYAQEYNLNSSDLEIRRTIYNQLQKYTTLQNSITGQYTRNPIDLKQICIVYFGEKPILGCYYDFMINNNALFTNSLEIDEKGNLSEIDFDLNSYTKSTRNDNGFFDTSTVTSAVIFGSQYDDDSNIQWLCYIYAEYKDKRQDKYGDLVNSDNSFSEKLDNNQTTLLNNILNCSNEWETYHNSWNNADIPCIYINIWSFGDGTAEMLCTHGSIDFKTEKSTQYNGTNHGYLITQQGISELDDSALERLENDLSNQKNLYWSNDWIKETKKEKLAEYILEIS